MNKFLKQLFCGHPRIHCEKHKESILGAETRITYSSPWSLFGTRETQYECKKCGGLFWYPSGNFEEEKMMEETLEKLVNY